MIFGVDYYPEHWDREEWEKQADLMKEGGFNTVRMAEFAWNLMEPEEGKYDFSWLDDAIDILSERGVKVILGTPTATPPKWLVNRYDILQRDRYGRVCAWGSRRACCANSKKYQELTVKLVTEMAKHYQNHPSVIGWQVDNEFGCHNSTRCYCEECRKEFGNWLKKKYSSVEDMNRAWGTRFWGLDFGSFEDIILPGYNSCEGETYINPAHNPSLELEYRRFASDSWVKYQQIQIDCIRKYSAAPITHNFMGHASDIDYYKLGKNLDFVSWDSYPRTQWGQEDTGWYAMGHEIMYGAKNQNYIVMEQQAGPCGWEKVGITPRPGQLRLWTYGSVAHGAEGIVYFRFRTALFGMEQYWYGVLDHDGKPRRRFYELVETGKELQKLGEAVTAGKKNQEVMIYRSFDDVWSHEIKYHCDGFYYEGEACNYFRANQRLGVTPAVSDREFEHYKVVYFPGCNIVSEELKDKIEKYVENGGVAVITCRSGLRNEENVIYPLPVPGMFYELAGVEAEEFDAKVKGVPVKGLSDGTAKIWCDVLKPNTAETIYRYDGEYYAGQAAVTKNAYGKGFVYYVGCILDETTLQTLIGKICADHGVPTYDIPDNVERVEKGDCIFWLNHNDVSVQVPAGGVSALRETEFDGTLPAYGVEVIRK